MKKFSTVFILALAIASTFTLASCKKDQTRTEMLTSGTWEITAVKADTDGNGSPETDLYLGQDVCTYDNYITFFAGGTSIEHEGADVCVGEAPETTGTWSFNGTETTLTYSPGGFTDVYTITAFSNNEIKVTALSIIGTLYVTFNKR